MNIQQVSEQLTSMSDRLDAIEQKLSALTKPSLATGFVFTAPEGTRLICTSPKGSKRPVYQLVSISSNEPQEPLS